MYARTKIRKELSSRTT